MSVAERPAPVVARETPYSWAYVGIGFITQVVGINTVSVLFNVLGASMRSDLGFSSAVLSGGLSIFTICNGISVLSGGFLLDRFGVRRVALSITPLFVFGIMAMSIVPSAVGVFFIICIVIGLGTAPAQAVTYAVIIRAWFGRYRGFALGLVALGSGACTTVMPYVAAGLLGAVGWRGTWAIVGLLPLIVFVVAYGFLIRMPADYEAERKRALAERRTAGPTFVEAVKGAPRAFWLISISIFLISTGTAGVVSQIVPITTGQGVSASVAVMLLSITGISSIAARLVVGFLLDHVFAPILAAIFFALCGLGLVLLITNRTVPMLVLGAVLVGFGPGSESDIIAYLVSRYVPGHSYGRIYGFVAFLYAWGVALGVFLLGESIAATGSVYVSAWLIVGFVAVAAALILFVGPYKYRVDGSLHGDEIELVERDADEEPAAEPDDTASRS